MMKRILFFLVLAMAAVCASGQRDSLYMSKLRTYQPIDTTEIDRDVEYEVVLKHYSVDEGSVIRRDTVAGYAADYLRQLILDAERDSVNLKSFLEVHFGNFKKANTDYFNAVNYLAALRSVTGGGAMAQRSAEASGSYIGRIIDLYNKGAIAATDSLIIGVSYYIADYQPTDDFSNVGGMNYTGNTFVATAKTPANWTNGSQLYLTPYRDTSFTTGVLDIGKIYYVSPPNLGDDFSNLYYMDSLKYSNPFYNFNGILPDHFVATEQPTSWINSTSVIDRSAIPIVYKNDLGVTVSFYRYDATMYLVYSSLPVFNNPEYLVELQCFTSGTPLNIINPYNQNVAVIYDVMGGRELYDINLKITKF